MRGHLDAELGPEFAQLADFAARMRRMGVQAGLDAAQRERAAAAALPRLLELLRKGRREEAERLAAVAAVEPPEAAPWS
jgi:hypothetical protein